HTRDSPMPSFAAPNLSLRSVEFPARIRDGGVKDKLDAAAKPGSKPWMAAVGKLIHLRKETARINRIIERGSRRLSVRTVCDPRYQCTFCTCRRCPCDSAYPGASVTSRNSGHCSGRVQVWNFGIQKPDAVRRMGCRNTCL